METAHHVKDSNKILDQLLAGRDTRWYRGSLGKLNLIIALLIITSMTNGYDGSMMVGRALCAVQLFADVDFSERTSK